MFENVGNQGPNCPCPGWGLVLRAAQSLSRGFLGTGPPHTRLLCPPSPTPHRGHHLRLGVTPTDRKPLWGPRARLGRPVLDPRNLPEPPRVGAPAGAGASQPGARARTVVLSPGRSPS